MNATHEHDKLHDYVDGQLSPEERSAFESHLKTCGNCRIELHAMENLRKRLAVLPREIQPKQDLWKQIETKLESQLQPPASGLEKRRNGQLNESRQDRLGSGLRLMWYMRAAAVVLILAGAGGLTYLFLRSPGDSLTRSSSTSPSTLTAPAIINPAPEKIDSAQSTRSIAQQNPTKAIHGTPPNNSKGEKNRNSPDESLAALKRIQGGGELPPTPLASSVVGRIVGTVSDAGGLPVRGATVQLTGINRSVFSDANGEFEIYNVPLGTYTLKAHSGGYKEIAIPDVKIISGFTAMINFQLGSGTVTSNDLVKDNDSRVLKFAATSVTLLKDPHAPSSLQAQGKTGKIGGRIVDERGQPVAGATVLVEGTQRGAATDTSGHFIIAGVPAGAYSVKAVSVGYAPTTVTNVKVVAESWTTINFTLKTEAVALHAVEITAESQLVNSLSTSSAQVVASENISGAAGVKGAEDVLKLQAGAVNHGNNLYLRGGRAGEVSYLVDGIDQQLPPPPPSSLNTEQYDNITENEYLSAYKNPLSTFSIDVDNASYSNVRRFINQGQMPPRDAVRIEELVNYFSYDYPQPKGNDPFSITTEAAACPWKSSNKLLLVGLQGKKVVSENLPPSNLVFLIDVSGSMNEPTKLPLVKSAFRLLVEQLREQDRVSIVVYAGNAGLVLPSTRGDQKAIILSAIGRLQAGGSTAGGEGLVLAYNIARENFLKEGNNRVILATDGDFNVGVSSDEGLVRLIEERRDQGIYLSVLGFGMGNYKDSKMEKLADKGNGNYAYIDNIQEARRVFVSQMAGTLFTIAKDVKIQIEFNPANVKAYRLIGYENRMLAKEDFNDDRKDAGELGSGHTVTALYEIVPVDGGREYSGVDDLKYQSDHQQQAGKHFDEMLTIKLRYKPPTENESKLIVQIVPVERQSGESASVNLRFASSVAEFGMLLRGSKFKESSSFDQVITLAQSSKGSDSEGYRAEFIRLAQAVKELVK